MIDTVRVPPPFEPIFQKAQDYVSKYFEKKEFDPTQGTLQIFDQRYIVVRAASMSIDFFEIIKNLYSKEGEKEAIHVARNLLFDMAHAIGRADARNFHKMMNVEDPIEKLSAGPIHFSYSGWAFVDIFPESNPTPDEDYFLIYEHPFSFEADSWIKADRSSSFPVCIMNAGYSSGWCEESFGVKLVATEIMCRAMHNDSCRFIMGHPSKIMGYLEEYLKEEPELLSKISQYEVPDFFKRKQIEEELKKAHKDLEIKVQERTKELEEKIEELEKFRKVTVGRELKMIELKERIKDLEKQLAAK